MRSRALVSCPCSVASRGGCEQNSAQRTLGRGLGGRVRSGSQLCLWRPRGPAPGGCGDSPCPTPGFGRSLPAGSGKVPSLRLSVAGSRCPGWRAGSCPCHLVTEGNKASRSLRAQCVSWRLSRLFSPCPALEPTALLPSEALGPPYARLLPVSVTPLGAPSAWRQPGDPVLSAPGSGPGAQVSLAWGGGGLTEVPCGEVPPARSPGRQWQPLCLCGLGSVLLSYARVRFSTLEVLVILGPVMGPWWG